mmetsp:Transcript_72841/g.206713  ORF Transcript_72841/g.206713 Transcript_72841/m.206713 type:complete len:233 (+) Transcript_72841:1060-1758(+)
MLGEETLGEGLRGLQLGSRLRGPEARNAGLLAGIREARTEWHFRPHEDQGHLLLHGEGHESRDVRVGHRDVADLRLLGGTAVAGGAVDLPHTRGGGELGRDGVLAAAAAHDQYIGRRRRGLGGRRTHGRGGHRGLRLEICVGLLKLRDLLLDAGVERGRDRRAGAGKGLGRKLRHVRGLRHEAVGGAGGVREARVVEAVGRARDHGVDGEVGGGARQRVGAARAADDEERLD